MSEERKPPVFNDYRTPKYPVVLENPTTKQIWENCSKNDFTQAAGLGAVCFPLGYLIGRQLSKPLAVPGFLFSGIIGTLGGVMLAYDNSKLRLQGHGQNDDEVARFLTPKESS